MISYKCEHFGKKRVLQQYGFGEVNIAEVVGDGLKCPVDYRPLSLQEMDSFIFYR